MDLSCPWTVPNEIFHKCRETIPLVQVRFRFELSFTVSKLLLKIWVKPWNFDKIFAVFSVFLREMASEEFWNYRIIQTTLEYTIPENLVRIGRVVSENERWIKIKNKTRLYTAMRYCIGSLRDNQRTWSCLIWIDCVWKKSVDNEALVAWPSRDFRHDMT